MLKKILLVVAGLFILLIAAGVTFIGPRNVVGVVRYGHTEEGTLFVGDRAPDAVLVSLDGQTQSRLHEHIGDKPLVLLFGSFT